MTEKETARFRAVADDGEEFTVIGYATAHDKELLNGSAPIVKGRKLIRWALDDGRELNEINSTTFKIERTDKIIRKVG